MAVDRGAPVFPKPERTIARVPRIALVEVDQVGALAPVGIPELPRLDAHHDGDVDIGDRLLFGGERDDRTLVAVGPHA